MQFFSSIARIAETRKFWIAVLTALGVFISTLTGKDIGLDDTAAQALVNLVIGLIGARAVWQAANR
jgi:uncharacterized membrane protein (DUF441 family)